MKDNLKYLPEFNALFPLDKPKVKIATSDGSSLWAVFFCFLFGLGVCAFFVYKGVEIYEDYQIKQNQEFVNGRIEGKCKTRSVVFVDCDVKIRYGGKMYEKNFAFFDLSSGDYTVSAVRHRDNHELVTVDLALDKILSRVIVSIAFSLLGLGMFVFSLYLLFVKRPKIKYLLREINQGDRTLGLFSLDEDLWEKKKQIKYLNSINGTEKEIVFAQTMKGEKYAPYFFAHDNELYVLVITNRETGNFLVVDQGLNRFKMSKIERKQLSETLEKLG